MAPVLSRYQKIGLCLALAIGTQNKNNKKRRTWVKEYLTLRGKLLNLNIVSSLEAADFLNYFRIDSRSFDILLNLITPYIQKRDTILRNSISAKERLIVTLRFLATGNSYQDLRFSSLISQSLLTKIIPETCWAINNCLAHYIKLPDTESEWRQVAEEFEEKWNFDHCIGACDGKHVAIQKPPGSGSLFYNYKGFFSIILFAVVNANYEFMYIQCGTNGSVNDNSVLESTKFYQKLVNGNLNLPPPSPLPGTETDAPYVLLGDSAFSINKHFMKPYPLSNINRERRIFNYRLSRARRVVENAFGILASRFRVLQRPLNLHLSNVDAVIMACCTLHNFMRKRDPRYVTRTIIDRENTSNGSISKGDWRKHTDGLISLKNTSKIKRNEEGNKVRDTFMKYFNSVGSVSFQDKMIDAVPNNIK